METTSNRLLWRIAGPMILLSVVLFSFGALAAWNVYRQQLYTSDLIVKEVHSIITVEKLNLNLREIRYTINLYLRSEEPKHLDAITQLHTLCDELLLTAKLLASRQTERDLLALVSKNYEVFFAGYSDLLENKDSKSELEKLSDDFLSNEVLRPLEDYVRENESVVDRTYTLGRANAKQIALGMLLLGICGGAAGALSGVVVARAVGRSIVQLNVSVQSVASRLSNIKGAVTFTHLAGTDRVPVNLKSIEQDIEEVIQAFQKSESALLRNEQLARVGQMAAGLAHELRNPLMPMKMLVQAALYSADRDQESIAVGDNDLALADESSTNQLADKRPGEPPVYLSQRSLKILNNEILRLEQTIQSFLDFARPNEPKRELQDIKELLNSSAQFLSPRMRVLGISMETQFPGHSVMACVDKNQIRQLFLNLLQNSIDAMPGGGVLTVTLSEGENITIVFKDTGKGIPADLIDQIFEPFVTSKESGTGLGLSICKQIASAHGGDLTARNQHGAIFELTIRNAAPIS